MIIPLAAAYHGEECGVRCWVGLEMGLLTHARVARLYGGLSALLPIILLRLPPSDQFTHTHTPEHRPELLIHFILISKDAHSCKIGLGSGKAGECSFFGCFDGHGGSMIANHR